MSRALGRYELLRPLARGGMAEVYLARRRSAGVEKWLVVKRIRAERATDVQFLDLFVREARLSMSLAHQNIVPVFDFGRIDDQVFLAMERVEGRDLGSSLAQAQSLSPPHPLSPLLASFIAAECCQALDYAHRRKSPEGTALGIVHRDVTPRNVLLSWSGEVKLTDFGIAALAGDATTALLGTPAYMAPEQARKETLDARTDVYAVGLVLREMLTGERARAGSDRESLVGAARAGSLRPWPEHAVPAELVDIVDRATAAKPSDRHTDARALLAELDDFLVGQRAAHKADAPARQLAAWLDAVWGAEREEEAASSGEIVADHMVSFLDDGALDVVGTGTQRSLLATAGEEGSIAAAIEKPIARRGDKVALAETVVAEPEPPEPKPVAVVEGGTWRWIVLAIAALLAIGSVVFVVVRSRAERNATADASIATSNTDATGIGSNSDASGVVVAVDATGIEGDAAVVGQTADAKGIERDAAITTNPRDAAIASARDAAIATNPRDAASATSHDAALATARDAAPAAKRRVRISATPWAYFTIDDDPTRHEDRSTVELSPGTHVIHYDNPELKLTRDVTIEVPTDRDITHVEHLQ